MDEIKELEARIDAIQDKKIIEMDLEELKTFVLTLNSRIIIFENNFKIINGKIDEINDNFKGFRGGVVDRYVTVDNFNNSIQNLLKKINGMPTKADFGLTDNSIKDVP